MQKRQANEREKAKKIMLPRRGNTAAAATTKLTTSSSSNNLTLTTRPTTGVMQANFYTARSKRRRRRSRSGTNTNTATTTTTNTTTTTTTSSSSITGQTAAATTTSTHLTPTSTSRQSALQKLQAFGAGCSSTATAYVALLLLSTTCSLCAASSPCAPNHWWDPQQDKCQPCTACQGEMIPLRPCQLHRDTICGSIYDLKIDWVVLAKTEPNWKERRKSEYEHFEHAAAPLQHLTHEQLQQLQDEAAAALPLDWQTGALFMAVLACLLFFSVAACILIHHMRQWRRMEQRLDQDVEELSTKLMAKLAEVQSLEGGTFFIGNADVLRGMPTSAATASAVAGQAAANAAIFQPHHVLLPDKHGKHHERRILKTLQPGNVYIEENGGSKG